MAFKTVVFKTVLFIPSHFKPKIRIIASMIQLFLKTCFQTTILAEDSLLEVPIIINKQKKDKVEIKQITTFQTLHPASCK